MSDHGLSPEPDPPQPSGAGHFRTDDDIELPPEAAPDAGGPATAGWPSEQAADKPSRLASLFGATLIIAVLAAGGWWLSQGGSAEQQHPNWRHVAAANDASTSGTSALVQPVAGADQTAAAIEVDSKDRDRTALRKVKAALRRGDLVTATAELQAAQDLPTASQNPDVRPPQLVAGSDLVSALEEGRQELYRIELFDCCDEDGDIVEVLVNGAPFATAPLLHEGTKLAVPLAQGTNTVTVRGVKDGGGGVTLSFRTSRGDYFARSIRVGQEYQMEVVVR